VFGETKTRLAAEGLGLWQALTEKSREPKRC